MERAEKILAANLSPRYWRLDRFERYVEGTQYDGRPDWFSPKVETPLLERRPCIVFPIVKMAIDSHIAFAMGNDAFPEIEVSDDEGAFDPRFDLAEEEASKLHEFIETAWEQANIERVSREVLANAMGSGTAVSVVGVKRGRLNIETIKASWCKPTFSDGGDLEMVEVCYPYISSYQDEKTGKWEKACLLYRRVITAESDTVYKPIQALESGVAPKDQEWEIKTEVVHNLGFCPVVWYKYMSGCEHVEDNDGHPIHERLLDEVDAMNFCLSQKHRAALYCTDPIIVEIGVSKDEMPGPEGRRARPVILRDDGGHSYVGLDQSPGMARKRAPGIVYQYESPDVKVEMLTLPADALKASDDNARDITAKLKSCLSFVELNAEKMDAQAWSGAAIKSLARAQVEYCDMLRADFAQGWLIPVTSMMLRICLKIDGVYMPGLKPIRKTLARFDADGMWFDPPMKVCWGEYFPEDASALKAKAEATIALFQAGVITLKSAVEEIKDFYGIENVEEYVGELSDAADSLTDAMARMNDSRTEAEPEETLE